MNTPEDMEVRRTWAALYAKTAIQGNNLSHILLDETLHENIQKAREFGYLVMTFGAGIEDLLSKLYDLASTTYQVPRHDFMLMGGFRALKNHREQHHNPNNHHNHNPEEG